MKVNSSGALEVVSGDSTAKGLFASSGKTRITIVDGTARTGLYAPDGSLNVVVVFQDDPYLGVYHPCGAMRGTIWDGSRGQFAPNGAVYMEGLWTPYTGAEVHIDFVNRGYYWNGRYRAEEDFTTFTGATFGTGTAAGLTGAGTAANHDITLDWAALNITVPFVAAVVFRPALLDGTSKYMVNLEAAASPAQNRTSITVATTNESRHSTLVGNVSQSQQSSTSALTVDTNYCQATLIQTDLFRNSLSGFTAGAEDSGGTLPTYNLIRFLENVSNATPFTGAIRHVLFFQNTGGAEISQADLNTLTAALDDI